METESLTMDAEEQAMRDLGQATDANEGRTPEPPKAETPEPRAPEEASSSAEATEDKAEPQPPEAEQPQKPEPEPELTPEQQLGRDIKTGQFTKREKPETEYSRAQKEEIRKARTWQNIQAEKEQVRAEKAQWEEQRRMEQLEAARQQYQPLKKEGLTAQEYMEGARRFEQEGDFENAYKAHQVALQLGQAEQERARQMQLVEAEYQWRMGMQEATKKFPDIWNTDAPIAQNLERIIARIPGLYHLPNGFMLATEAAHMLAREGLMKEKDDRILFLEAELEKFQKKSQPGKSGVASPRLGEKDFDDMSLDEMEAHLKGLTAEADNYR